MHRAQQASRALEPLVVEKAEPNIHIVEDHDVVVIYAGQTPVVQLTPEDAQAAGDASLKIHAARVAAKIRNDLSAERQRHQAAQGVFSVSLLVFSGLIVFLLFRKLDELTERLRERLQGQRGEKLRFRLGGVDVLSPAVLLGTLHVSLSAGRVLLRGALGYGWLLFALSQFDWTQGYTERLTRALVTPLSDLLKRLVSTAPLLVVVTIVLFVLLVFLRFLRIFFQGYAEGTNQSQLVPPDLAVTGGALAQITVVVLAVVAILPLVTGDDQGTAGRLGGVALAAIGLGITPLIATSAVGTLQIFGRRLRLGDRLHLGKYVGRIVEINLLETQIKRDTGGIVRIPHLLGLLRATQIQRLDAVEVTICVAPEVDPQQAHDVLQETATQEGRAHVTLTRIDRDGALFHIQLTPESAISQGELLLKLATALRQQNLPLGRLPATNEAP